MLHLPVPGAFLTLFVVLAVLLQLLKTDNNRHHGHEFLNYIVIKNTTQSSVRYID